jgi:hypothetical protein
MASLRDIAIPFQLSAEAPMYGESRQAYQIAAVL